MVACSGGRSSGAEQVGQRRAAGMGRGDGMRGVRRGSRRVPQVRTRMRAAAPSRNGIPEDRPSGRGGGGSGGSADERPTGFPIACDDGNPGASGHRGVPSDGVASGQRQLASSVEWRMVFEIAHQVVRTSCSLAPPRSSTDPHPSPKNADGPLPRSTFHPVPDIPRDRASSTAAPCLRSPRHKLQSVKAEETARETTPTPLTPLTLREAHSLSRVGDLPPAVGAGYEHASGEPVAAKKYDALPTFPSAAWTASTTSS